MSLKSGPACGQGGPGGTRRGKRERWQGQAGITRDLGRICGEGGRRKSLCINALNLGGTLSRFRAYLAFHEPLLRRQPTIKSTSRQAPIRHRSSTEE